MLENLCDCSPPIVHPRYTIKLLSPVTKTETTIVQYYHEECKRFGVLVTEGEVTEGVAE
jgi:hypothetical protein